MADVGDKFIIELDSKMTHKGGFVYGLKDVSGLYVDDEIISYLNEFEDKKVAMDDLEEIIKAQNKNTEKILTVMQENYFRECGMKEAWNCITKIYLSPENGGYSKEILKEIFLESDFSSIISDFSIMEIVEKIKLYEEENKIDVGDETISNLDNISINTRYTSIGEWFCELSGISSAFIQDKEKVEEILMKIKNNAMDKMWEMAREIALIDVDCADSLSGEDIQEMFGVKTPYKVFYNFTAQEVVKTIEANEKQSKEFSLWDEVTCGDTKAVILDTSDGCFKALYENGVICNISPQSWKKTGRSFPQIAEILKEMRCEDGRED